MQEANYNINKLSKALDSVYNKTDLEKAYRKIASNFIKEHIVILKETGVSFTFLDLPSRKSFTKLALAQMAAVLYCTKTAFQAFRESLTPEAREVLDTLVWEEKLSQKEIKELLRIDIVETSDRKLYGGGIQTIHQLKPEFAFFANRNRNYWYSRANGADFLIWLPEDIRKVICQYYTPPKGATLQPLEEKPVSTYSYTSGETDIILELPRLFAFHDQGQIKVTAKGLPLASTINKTQKKLNLREFFPETKDKILKNIRTHLLTSLVLSLTKQQKSRNDLPSLIKEFLFLTNFSRRFSSFNAIMTELKGTGYVESYSSKIEDTYFRLLKKFPEGKWISVENLQTYLNYNFIDNRPITTYLAKDKLYYTLQHELGYKEKKYIDENLYKKAIIQPYMKGVFFLFAAFGLVDIAYNIPDTKNIGESSYSQYDELKGIRLTPLGAYVSNQVATYEPKEVIKDFDILLSEDALMITTHEEDRNAAIILEPFTEQVGPNRYRTDNTFFLNGCRSKRDLQSKVALFQQSIGTKLPANWEQFFKTLEGKIDPLERVDDLRVFQIPSENRELIRLIARDATLKKLLFKAENYMVLIPIKNVPRFKKRLQEFGYLITT